MTLISEWAEWFRWSIYKDYAADKPEYDLTAPVPDGEYDVCYRYFDPRINNGEKNGRHTYAYNTGIIIRNKQFDLNSVYDTLAKVTMNDYSHHTFIESLDWNGKYFEVHLGS